jgi:hypothetical protein
MRPLGQRVPTTSTPVTRTARVLPTIDLVTCGVPPLWTVRPSPRAALLLPILLALGLLSGASALAEDTEPPLFGADHTPTIATTGDNFTFAVEVEDETGLLLVEVHYSFGEGAEYKAPLKGGGPGIPWTLDIKLPTHPETIHYMFRAQDFALNIAVTETRHVQVVDNDPPTVLFDSSSAWAEPGATYVFGAELSDNDAIGGAWVIHWFDEDGHENLTMLEGHPYHLELLVPMEGVGQLNYYFEVMDRRGNGMRTDVRSVPVVADRTPPRFGRDSTSTEGFTGDEFRFVVEVTDDIELQEVRVLYRFGDSTVSNRSLEGENPYTLTLGVPSDSTGDVNYSFYATDSARNINRTKWMHVTVYDNDDPTAFAGMDVETLTNMSVTLNGTGSWDNIGVTRYLWTFEYDGAIQTLEGPMPTFRFRRPGNYEVTLVVFDAALNEATVEVTVMAREPPPYNPTRWNPQLGPHLSLFEKVVPFAVAIVVVINWAWLHSIRRRPQSWPIGDRSTSSRSQVGYSSTK